jgi:amino acid permease
MFRRVFLTIFLIICASFMNTVMLSSVLSAGNHAPFAGTHVLYSLSVTRPVAQAPHIFSWTTTNGVPLPTLLATSSVGALRFASSFIWSGEVWGWLQNIWSCKGTSVRFLTSPILSHSPPVHMYSLYSPLYHFQGPYL